MAAAPMTTSPTSLCGSSRARSWVRFPGSGTVSTSTSAPPAPTSLPTGSPRSSRSFRRPTPVGIAGTSTAARRARIPATEVFLAPERPVHPGRSLLSSGTFVIRHQANRRSAPPTSRSHAVIHGGWRGRSKRKEQAMRNRWTRIARRTVAAAALAVVSLWPAGAAAQEGGAETPVDDGAYCSATTAAVYEACLDEARADYKLEVGKCLNIALDQARANCLAQAQDARDEAIALCKTQRVLRRNICTALGEARYEPNFDPARFDQDLGNLTNPNPYFPLSTGYHWEFEGSEHVTVEVLDKVKLIAGNRCFVVNDRVIVDGVVVEDTDDWFAHAK